MFIDVDGTILEHGSVIAPSTIVAIRAARARGHLVFLCTGRSRGNIHPEVSAIGFDGAITNSGAFATIDGRQALARVMSRADLDRLTTYFAAHDIEYALQSDEHVFVSPGLSAHLDEFARRRAAERADDRRRLGLDADDADAAAAEVDRYLPLADADLDAIAKAVFVSERDGAVERVHGDLGDRFHVIPGSIPLPGGSNGELSLQGVNKGSAILEVLDLLGRDAADAIGIGDSWNDVEMFEVCGTSVAMAGADAELRARVDHVTTGVLDDGVSNAFSALHLI